MKHVIPKARPLALPLLVIGLFLTAPIAAGQLVDPADHTCPDAETLEVDGFLVCLAWQVEQVGDAPGDPMAVLSSGCWPQSWRTVHGDPEEEWTPLYGANSPRFGRASLTLEEGQTKTMSIGFTFKETGVKLSKAETVSGGVSLAVENGESVVKYQIIEWSPFEKQYCGWDWSWHKWEAGYEPTDYTPWGEKPLIVRGHLEGASTFSDTDNTLIPSEDWYTSDNTIALGMRFVDDELTECMGDGDRKFFGEDNVYSVGASLEHKGIVEGGWTRTRTKASTFEYSFTDGCYDMDYLNGSPNRSGLAFRFNETADDIYGGGSGECSGKSLMASPMSCAEEPCGDALPSVALVQDTACGALPDCDDLEDVPIACSGLPPECGAGTEPGEACLPGRPEGPGCPPDAVALPGDSCDPCDALKVPLIECGIGPPTCEDAGTSPCPPVQRPCSDYAPGLSGEVARWVCERDAPDPCEVEGLNQLEAVFHCGDDGAEG